MATDVRRRFEASAEGVRAARRFYREATADRVDPEVAADLDLALSEMATNAVKHARTPFVVAIHTDGNLRVAVADGSTTLPVRRQPGPTDTSGRGLLILDAVCDDWGVHLVDGGKCVWCERALPLAPERV
jgi:anti-sigma regulatory factor (Ser/Thr protein kinase)